MAGLGEQPQAPLEQIKIWGIYGNNALDSRHPSEYENRNHHQLFHWSQYARRQGWRDLTAGYGVKVGQDDATVTQLYGPEIAFGHALKQFVLAKHEHAYIVKLAIADTDIDAWTPDRYLYQQLLDMVAQAVSSESRYNLQIRGILWMQGESDANTLQAARLYQDRLAMLIENLRTDLQTRQCRFAIEPVPFVIGKIAPSSAAEYTDSIRQAQQQVANTIEHVYIVDTIHLPKRPNDPWHFDSTGQEQLGQLFFEALFKH